MNIKETEKDIEQKVEEYFEKQLERVNSWLSFAEAKNVGLIAANVAILAVVIELFHDAPLFCVIAGTVTLVSCALCLFSFIPIFNSKDIMRQKSKYNPKKDYNLIFYMDIAEIGNLNSYISLVNKKYFENKGIISNKASDLAFEVMENCKITMNKYKLFRYALKVDLVALVCIVVLFIAA